MTTSRIKEKLSTVLSSQLPEFVTTDYPLFVSFVEAYYRFLEQDQGSLEIIQNARSYNDLDLTIDSFLDYFLKSYAVDFPITTEVNTRFLLKKIKYFYESKGSETSFKFLFNLLFNEDVELVYPFQNVLIASGGNWAQKSSIRVETVSGDREELLNRAITYTSNGQTYNTPVTEVKYFSDTITEIFLDSTQLASSYTIGDQVYVYDANGIVFTGNIAPTPLSYVVIRRGLGFRTGQIYNVNFSGGSGTLLRVSNVGTSGNIFEVKFVTYGSGYPNETFDIDLDPSKTVAASSEVRDEIIDKTQGFKSFGEIYSFNSFTSNTQGFGSSGSVLVYDPTDPNRYFEDDYVLGAYTYSSVATTFNDNVFNPQSETEFTLKNTLSTFGDNVISPSETVFTKPGSIATIRLSPGALTVYPGTYLTNEGFISELDIRLQDGLLYQPFAYQTNTQLDVSEFFDLIKQLVHPAGQKLVNNRLLLSQIDLNSNISVVTGEIINTELLSVFDMLDQHSKLIGKNIEGEDFVIPSEEYTLSINKPINISVGTSDSISAVALIQDYFESTYVNDDYVGSLSVIF